MTLKTIATSIWSAVSTKARLYIEYALIALFIFACSWGITLWVQNHSMQKTINELNVTNGSQDQSIKQLIQDNLDNKAAIATMQITRQLDHNTIQGLVDGLTDVYTRSAKNNERLGNLEKRDAKAKAYLHDDPVPDSVRCLLDHTPCPAPATDEDSDKKVGPAVQPKNPVPASSAGKGKERSASILLQQRRDSQRWSVGGHCSRLRRSYAVLSWMDRCRPGWPTDLLTMWANNRSRSLACAAAKNDANGYTTKPVPHGAT